MKNSISEEVHARRDSVGSAGAGRLFRLALLPQRQHRHGLRPECVRAGALLRHRMEDPRG